MVNYLCIKYRLYICSTISYACICSCKLKEGTGTAAQFESIEMAQAGKTGTTSDNTDYWFEGYTPYYTAGIWYFIINVIVCLVT